MRGVLVDGAKANCSIGSGLDLEPDRIPVEVADAVEVGNRQADGAHRSCGVDGAVLAHAWTLVGWSFQARLCRLAQKDRETTDAGGPPIADPRLGYGGEEFSDARGEPIIRPAGDHGHGPGRALPGGGDHRGALLGPAAPERVRLGGALEQRRVLVCLRVCGAARAAEPTRLGPAALRARRHDRRHARRLLRARPERLLHVLVPLDLRLRLLLLRPALV